MRETIFTRAKSERERRFRALAIPPPPAPPLPPDDSRARRFDHRESIRLIARAEREYWNTWQGQEDLQRRRESDKALNEKLKAALVENAVDDDEFLNWSKVDRCLTCHGRGIVGHGCGHYGGVFIDDEGISQLPLRHAHCVCPECAGAGFLAATCHA